MRILLIITATILICMLVGSLGWLVIYEIKKPINMLIEKFIEWYLRRIKNETRQLKELQTQLENNKNVSLKVKGYVRERFSANYVRVSILVAFAAAVIFIVAAVISSKCFDFYIDNKDVVLTFVGIIATFIVVTNYAQVIEIKRQFYQQLKNTEEKLQSMINDTQDLLDVSINQDLFKLGLDIAFAIDSGQTPSYNIEIVQNMDSGEQQQVEAFACWDGNVLQFKIQQDNILKNVEPMKIDDVVIQNMNSLNLVVSHFVKYYHKKHNS